MAQHEVKMLDNHSFEEKDNHVKSEDTVRWKNTDEETTNTARSDDGGKTFDTAPVDHGQTSDPKAISGKPGTSGTSSSSAWVSG